MLRSILGLLLGFSIGFFCGALKLPAPCPPVVEGALFVLCITIGYLGIDKYLRAKTLGEK